MGRVMCQRCPDLRAVDDEVIAIGHRLSGKAGKVGPGIRLGVALAPDVLAGDDPGQVALFLFLGAVAHQQRPDHGHALVRMACHAPAFALLDENHLLVRRQTHATEFLRP